MVRTSKHKGSNEMTINNPVYASKSTAKRGAQRHGIANPKLIALPDGKVEVRDMDRPLYNWAVREKSEVKGAVAIVWDIAKAAYDAGDARRKDIIAACVEAGVALNTAKTQLQHYRAAAGLVKARA
jgi:hypothetical protein